MSNSGQFIQKRAFNVEHDQRTVNGSGKSAYIWGMGRDLIRRYEDALGIRHGVYSVIARALNANPQAVARALKRDNPPAYFVALVEALETLQRAGIDPPDRWRGDQ